MIETIDKKAYLSALSLAKYICVTCDSTSMISEAAMTGKPIYVAHIPPVRRNEKFIKFFELFKSLKIIKDLENSLNHLTENGTIVMHDCSPPTEWHQRPEHEYDGSGEWNGTTWKAYVEFKCKRNDLKMCVVDTDYGVGVIQRGKQKIWDKHPFEKCIQYDYLEKNRTKLLNLISYF